METVLSTDLAERIRKDTGENVFLCYQCVKCTSGCPLAEYFDVAPNQIMRATQLGMEELVFKSQTAWLCASCMTCTTRCPQGIDIARVMDFIVSEAIAEGRKSPVPEVALFNKVFLRNVNILGRAYEMGLMLEMNLRTGQLFKDVGMGLNMIRHRKINILPKVVTKRKPKAERVQEERPENQVGYYPGCSLHAMAAEFDHSTRAILAELGLETVEPEGWVCCGSTPVHRMDHVKAVELPMQSMVHFEKEGLDEIVLPCAACFNRFRSASIELGEDNELKTKLEDRLDVEYQGSLEILSVIDAIIERIGLAAVKDKVQRPLEGLKVACYYGCLLTRPPDLTGAENAEYPMALDYIMRALGAETIDWDHKVACCGASLSATKTEIVLELSSKILQDARARGADVLAIACPLCHINLDSRQTQMGEETTIPVLYFTQLMALAFGQVKQAALARNMIDPRPLLADRGMLDSKK
jgi:heterodisulfide reductase subunit B